MSWSGPGEALVLLAEVPALPAEPAASLRRHLSLAERLRVDRLVRQGPRDSSIAAHVLLNRSLTLATGRRARLWPGPFGRPEPHQPPGAPPLSVSLSHTAGPVARALARGGTVGLDVEAMSAGLDDAGLDLAGSAARAALFCRFWTLREAVAKALGTGLAWPLPALVIGLDPPSLSCRGDPAFAAGWQLAECGPTPRDRAALALRGTPGLAFRLRWQAVELGALAARGWAPG
jgi:4'-phosphopantetheinyl transferase